MVSKGTVVGEPGAVILKWEKEHLPIALAKECLEGQRDFLHPLLLRYSHVPVPEGNPEERAA